MIVCNTRTLSATLTGAQRYTAELVERLRPYIHCIEPNRGQSGAVGHLWEQSVLPLRLRDRLLWSPSNTGPLMVSRQVVTVHDVIPLDHPEWFSPRFVRWFRWLIPRLVRRVQRVITDSSFTRERIVKITGISEDKIVVVGAGVDRRFSPRSRAEVASLRKTLGIHASAYVLSLGSLEPRKNLPRLLQAWGRILPKLPPELWLLVAGAPGNPLIYRKVSMDNLPHRVKVMGYVADEHLPALYSGALAFAYPSLYEGFGLPVLEAMAAGVPSVASNRASLPEVAGDTGILVDPTDVDAIGMAIYRLVKDGTFRAELRRRCLERAAKFTWERTADLTLQVLKETEEMTASGHSMSETI